LALKSKNIVDINGRNDLVTSIAWHKSVGVCNVLFYIYTTNYIVYNRKKDGCQILIREMFTFLPPT
jgi:hypothetical protein